MELIPPAPPATKEITSGPSVWLPDGFVTADNGREEELTRRESSTGFAFLCDARLERYMPLALQEKSGTNTLDVENNRR